MLQTNVTTKIIDGTTHVTIGAEGYGDFYHIELALDGDNVWMRVNDCKNETVLDEDSFEADADSSGYEDMARKALTAGLTEAERAAADALAERLATPGVYVKGDERVAVNPDGQIGNDDGTFAQFPTVAKAVEYLTSVGYQPESMGEPNDETLPLGASITHHDPTRSDQRWVVHIPPRGPQDYEGDDILAPYGDTYWTNRNDAIDFVDRVAKDNAIEKLLVEWFRAAEFRVSEVGTSHDWPELIDEAKKWHKVFGIPWSNDFVPKYMREMLALDSD
jgi:hypothetical protein